MLYLVLEYAPHGEIFGKCAFIELFSYAHLLEKTGDNLVLAVLHIQYRVCVCINICMYVFVCVCVYIYIYVLKMCKSVESNHES